MQYGKFNRVLSYFTGLRLLASIRNIRDLHAARKRRTASACMSRRGVDMSQVIKNGGTDIVRQIKVGVVTIHPFECILNTTSSLLKNEGILPPER